MSGSDFLNFPPPPSPPKPTSALQAGEPFWMAWRVGGLPPKFKHSSYELADAEAQRLAREHVGSEFVVLESVRSHQVRALTTIDLRPDRGLPF